MDAVFDQEWDRQARGEPSTMIVLPIHDERLDGPIPQEDLSQVPAGSVKRRALAQQLHAQLADPPSWTGPDRFGWSVLDVPVARLDGVARALREAPAAAHDPRSVLITSGKRSGHVVLRLHGDTFSVVFHVSPGDGPVLVVLDELPGYAVRVDTDPDRKAVMQVMTMKFEVLRAVDKAERSRPAAGRAPMSRTA
ncbi:hypothetical protein RB614_15790 [Phytohabitans sp. ZYX-F-186]|uniref:ESX secretion-associated protein EspG n=1 Tax=Phytohabitans maris TaxID=3071409 RepID=A0ABU0ZFZ4_9ACTN|nr:hypothetical protein [Phytohabitans sp. ZYX-F-186]MDQ7905974.1 hypothetical protein [Phytohabitans sp. ZYX-F-186]